MMTGVVLLSIDGFIVEKGRSVLSMYLRLLEDLENNV